MRRLIVTAGLIVTACSGNRTTDGGTARKADEAVLRFRAIVGAHTGASSSEVRAHVGRDTTTIAVGEVSVGVSLVSAIAVEPIERDGLRIQPGAFAGGDRIHESRRDGIEEWVVLTRPEPRGALRWTLRPFAGVAGLRLVDDVLEVLDANGTPRLRAARPYVVDANHVRHAARLDVEDCAVDRSPAPPWGRTPVAPGAASCTMRVSWDVPDLAEGPLAVDPAWTATSNMLEPRSQHVAVQYAPGKVLVAGGSVGSFSSDILSTAETFDATTKTWSATESLAAGRYSHAAAKVATGVLVTGGYPTGSTLLWTTATGKWTYVNAAPNRDSVTAVTLPDGKVLVAGGRSLSTSTSSSSAEVIDPAAGTSTAVGSMSETRVRHRMVAVGGKVLVMGGNSRSSAELYDPTAKTFTATGAMSTQRGDFAATALGGNKVLVAGGETGTSADLSSAEVYDLATGTWTTLSGTLPRGVVHIGAALLPSGHALVVGGFPWDTFSVIDPTSGSVRDTSLLDVGYWNGVTALDDRVLVSGGWPAGPTDKSWLFAEQTDGATCGASGDCTSGKCYDGKCCSTCTGSVSCTTDAACAAGEWCDTTTTPGKCTTKKALGGACSAANQCGSGYCVDGVCCDTGCYGTCQACSAAKKGAGADGTCGAVADGTDPDNDCAKGTTACGADGMCNGAGACRTNAPKGVSCGTGSCTAGVASGLLCDGSGACIANTAACAPYACGTPGCKTTCTTDDDCAADAYCTTTGACLPKVSNGKSCALGKECKSGYCADGVCCNTACTGQCEACDVMPNVGSCSPVTGAPHGTKTKCKGDGACAGACDGSNAAACSYPGATTGCGSTCTDGKETKSACDGAGACVAGSARNCAPLVCGTEKCLDSCTKDEECSVGYACKDGACVPRPSAKCSDDRSTSVSTAGEQACAPYLCNAANGQCANACETTADCAGGYVCDGSHRCVPAPTDAATGDSGGCSTSTRGQGTGLGGVAGVAIALLAVVRASSRSRR